MSEEIQLNVPLLRRRVPNLTAAAKAVGLRPATVSNLCTGKIPLGRAEVRTLVALATLAGCSLDELVIVQSGIGMIETGIKVLDLFAPVVRGGVVGLVARPMMGQFVLLAEMFYRLRKRGYATVFWKPVEDGPGVEDVTNVSEVTETTPEGVFEQVVALRAERDVLLAVDRKMVLTGELLNLRERLMESGARPVTIVLVDLRGEAMDEELPYGPLDARLQFDMDLVARGLFPAVDPVASTSTLLEGAQMEAHHFQVQQKARKVLRRYRELRSLVRIHGTEKLREAELAVYRCGEELESFLAQPFYVAEPYTKRPGEWISLQESLDTVQRILEGRD